MEPEVRTYPGTPPTTAFGATIGTPIVIDTTTDTPYYLKSPGDVVTAFAGGGGGGTGTVTHTVGALTNHALTVGSGVTVDDIKSLAVATNGQIAVGVTGADPAIVSVSGDATLSAAGAVTLATVNATVGTFVQAKVTANAKGLATAVVEGWVKSSTAPVSPFDGMQWVNDTEGIEYRRYNDGTTTQWVEF